MKPCLIVRVEFVDENLDNATMTVVRLGGREVETDANDESFEITNEMIRYTGASTLTSRTMFFRKPHVVT